VNDARALVASARVARLGTINPAGGVDLVPITFAFLDDDTLVTAVDHKPKRTTALQRLDNVRAHPAVTVLVDHYDEDWSALWWVRLRGRAQVVDGGDELAAAVAALQLRYEQYQGRPPGGPAIAITIDRWSSWSAGP
jgi:PPOX class probable F420-dependent enzyme